MEMEQVDICWSLLRPIIENNDIQNYMHLIAGPQATTESVRRLYSLNIRKCVMSDRIRYNITYMQLP